LHALGFEARTMLTDELIAMLELDPKEIDAISSFEVVVPSWRADVTQEVDLVEEIGRIIGYDRVPEAIAPVLDQTIPSTAWNQQKAVAQAMVALGYREVIALGLQPASVAERWVASGVAAQATPLEVVNPLSEDQRFLRFSLVPGMLALGSDRIFEIGDVFARAGEIVERTHLTFLRRTRAPQSAPWSDLEFTAIKGDALAFVRTTTGRHASVRAATHAGWHPGMCAELVLDDVAVAIVGALDPRLAFAYDIEDRVHVAQIDLADLPTYRTPGYVPQPRYPSVTRDLALVLDPAVEAAAIEHAIAQSGGAHVRSVRAFDEYRGPQLGEGKKSLAVRVVLQRDDATMTDDEADAAISAILSALKDQFTATIRS
jgi:phenylalanyl-tRNA synthetase beta chain